MGSTFIVLMLSIPVTILRGYVLQIIWGWFVVPQFHVSPLNIPTALGIALLAGFVTSDLTLDRSHKTEPWEYLVTGAVTTLIYWLMGWSYHLFQ